MLTFIAGVALGAAFSPFWIGAWNWARKAVEDFNARK